MDVTNFYQDTPEKKLGICIFNRATYARSKVLINELLHYPNLKVTLFLSSSLLWEKFGKAADYIEREHKTARVVRIHLDPVAGTHEDMARGAGRLWVNLADAFLLHPCDAIILVADRWEVLPAAGAAAYLQIPIIHIQGGEITGCIDDKVRNAVTRLADSHFCSTLQSQIYLKESGESTRSVFHTGCPSVDLIRITRTRNTPSKTRYVLSIFHPETENASDAFDQTKIVLEAALAYCLEFGVRCHWYYPNPDPGREEIIRYLDVALDQNPEVFTKAINQEPEEFLKFLGGSRMIIGNSSCGIRESSYLGIPSVNIGSRQQWRERSWNVIDVGYDTHEILAQMKEQHLVRRYPRSRLYGSGNASEAIARYIQHMEFGLKGPLTYPLWPEFREDHFGEARFAKQQRKRRFRDRVQKEAQQKEAHACESGALQSEP